MECLEARYPSVLKVERIIWRKIVYSDHALTTIKQSCSDMHADETSRTSDERSQISSPFFFTGFAGGCVISFPRWPWIGPSSLLIAMQR